MMTVWAHKRVGPQAEMGVHTITRHAPLKNALSAKDRSERDC